MLVAYSLVLAGTIAFAPPQPWARDFAAPPRIPFVGDVDNDGLADLIGVHPPGASIIDVSLNVAGQKAGVPVQALSGWGKDCQAATVGEFDKVGGTDVAGLFDGRSIRIAGAFANNGFQDLGVVVNLPEALPKPCLGSLDRGKTILAFSPETRNAYRVNPVARTATLCSVPVGLVWIGDAGDRIVGQDKSGTVFWLDKTTLRATGKLGKEPKGSRPAASDNAVVFGEQVWTLEGLRELPGSNLPQADVVRSLGDFDHDGDLDIAEFRYGTELHTGNQVLIYRAVSPGETDTDHDGLTNEQEASLGTDPLNSDTDQDGLINGWETGTFRGLDLKALGCDPRHTDTICLVSRFTNVNETTFKSEMERVIKFYQDLKTPNPDGKTGFNFHPIFLDPVQGTDINQPWWANRDKFRPAQWKGVVHWMQVAQGGGGQADQLGDGGGVGDRAMWAVFVHEFGHQMGMDHEGFWPNSLCPIYTSLMNYAYSYWLEDDSKKIHYSDGALNGYVLRETDLDETIPLPYDKVKFLEKGPYRFRLKSSGQNTLIDWNWNGVFGEKHVRADVNYSYSTNAGRRDDAGRTQTAPWLFTHKKSAYLLYGVHDFPADAKTDPSVSPEKPGRLMLKRLVKPLTWAEPVTLDSGGLVGDPVATSFGGKIIAFYQTSQGVVMRKVDSEPASNFGETSVSVPEVVDKDWNLVPTVGVHEGRLYLFLTNPIDGMVTYKVMDSTGKFVRTLILDANSTNPVGICTDTLTGEAVVGLAQDQGATKTNRWQIRRYKSDKGKLVPTSMDWIDGEKGGSRGVGRIIVLFDPSKDAGPHGRVYLYGKGLTTKESPWSCTYVAHQIADKTVNGGWMVKRFYDEWTQTRSAPAAAWFGKDVIWAYRWVDGGQGASDNVLHVGYKALGIQDEPMGDHDDLTFFRTWGIQNSILYLSKE